MKRERSNLLDKLITLPVDFAQFKLIYNTYKDKWSFNEIIFDCVKDEERFQSDKIESAHLTLTSQNKKRKNNKGVTKGLLNDKLPTLVCSEVNLVLVPNDTWWVNYGATTHKSIIMQACGDDNQTFIVPSFRRNLFSISTLENFCFSYSFGNNKVSLYLIHILLVLVLYLISVRCF
ncbi:hypothetical protein Lal_00032828 [Lupinus albus]|nr:hypothetical protein Lal_00032828 [Lupinus albus]